MWVTERIQSPIQNLESIENEKENEKNNFVHFVGNLSRIPKLSLFYSSIKTEGVLFFSYIYKFIYICIYIKN